MTFLANARKCSINGNIVICYCELYCLWDNNNTNMGTVCVLIGLLLIKVLLFCCYWSV